MAGLDEVELSTLKAAMQKRETERRGALQKLTEQLDESRRIGIVAQDEFRREWEAIDAEWSESMRQIAQGRQT